MKNIETIYNSLWENSIQGFRNNLFKLDENIDNKSKDNRRGVTLIGRPDKETLSRMMDFLCYCKAIEPDQHYYERDDVHITILSIISCTDEFSMINFNKEAYVDVIEKSIGNIGPIEVEFKGITASPSCIMIQGFPINDRLELLRRYLRENFKSSDLKHSIDSRYSIETAHSTVIRFKAPIADNALFINSLSKYKNYYFGFSKIEQIEFVYNDWYMTNSIVSRIKTFYI